MQPPQLKGQSPWQGAEWELERQCVRGFFQLRAARAHSKSAGREAVEGEELSTENRQELMILLLPPQCQALRGLGTHIQGTHHPVDPSMQPCYGKAAEASPIQAGSSREAGIPT